MALEFKTQGGGIVRLVQGDITKQDVDVIVNAANSALQGGGGVDGAIHAAAGSSIRKETAAWVAENGQLDTSRVMKTGPGELSVKAIFHTVGPVYIDGYHSENTALEKCYVRALALAVDEGYRTIAFPAISTGVYNFPKDEAAYIVVGTCIRELVEQHGDKIDEVRLMMHTQAEYDVWAPIFTEVTETMTGTPSS